MIGGGVAIFDANNDGFQDLFIAGGLRENGFYLNDGNSFEQKVVYLNVEDIDYYSYPTIGITAADINNDGWDDLFLCTAEDYPNLILVNNKDNTFDVLPSDESGITEMEWSVSASFGDINKDGLLDIFVSNYINSDDYDPINNGEIEGDKNHLYINQGNLQFQEMSAEYGLIAEGVSLACMLTDFDNDNDVDVYVANDFGHIFHPNELYENQFPEQTLTDISVNSGANAAIFAMGIASGDFDGDLDLDYYITNIGKNVMLQNNGDKTFTDITNASNTQDSSVIDGLSVGWGTGFLDYDNDGYLDLYVSNGFIPSAQNIFNPFRIPNSLYKNNGDGTFNNVSEAFGFDLEAVCRGSAYGDLDNDGDLDLVVIPVTTTPLFPGILTPPEVAIFYNETVNDNHWISLDLKGQTSNSNGIGAHVYVYDSNNKAYLKEVNSGSSHSSSNSKTLHFGLGSATSIDSVVIIWPSGIHQTIENLFVDEHHTICEAECLSTEISDVLVDYKVDIYPNPTHGSTTININNSAKNQNYNYKIYSINGLLIESGESSEFPLEINFTPYNAGSYLVELTNENQHIGVFQLHKY